MPPKRRFKTCEICGHRANCENLKKRKFMAKFPLNEARCRQWVKFVGKEDLIYVPIEKLHELKYVCGYHFENRAFNKKKNRLKKSAVPSINLKADPLPDAMLLEFPCHIFSNIDVAKDCITQESSTSGQPQFLDHDYSNKMEKVLRSGSEPSTSGQPQLLDHDYSKKIEKIFQSGSEPSTSDQPQLLDHDYSKKMEEVFQSSLSK